MADTLVFMGDSITRAWSLPALFPNDAVYNAGIGGETTAAMLARFERDVIARSPQTVHILGGINDIAENGGPVTVDAIAANLQAMIDRARRNGIAVVVGTLLPCTNATWRPHLTMQPSLLALNAWIVAFANARDIILADYYTALADAHGGMPSSYGPDGVHPNDAGYAVMAPVARAALQQASRRLRAKC